MGSFSLSSAGTIYFVELDFSPVYMKFYYNLVNHPKKQNHFPLISPDGSGNPSAFSLKSKRL
jgi:hypothetical protein